MSAVAPLRWKTLLRLYLKRVCGLAYPTYNNELLLEAKAFRTTPLRSLPEIKGLSPPYRDARPRRRTKTFPAVVDIRRHGRAYASRWRRRAGGGALAN